MERFPWFWIRQYMWTRRKSFLSHFSFHIPWRNMYAHWLLGVVESNILFGHFCQAKQLIPSLEKITHIFSFELSDASTCFIWIFVFKYFRLFYELIRQINFHIHIFFIIHMNHFLTIQCFPYVLHFISILQISIKRLDFKFND